MRTPLRARRAGVSARNRVLIGSLCAGGDHGAAAQGSCGEALGGLGGLVEAELLGLDHHIAGLREPKYVGELRDRRALWDEHVAVVGDPAVGDLRCAEPLT